MWVLRGGYRLGRLWDWWNVLNELMFVVCVCLVFIVIEVLNNDWMWFVRVMFGIGLEWFVDEGLYKVLLFERFFIVCEI